MDAEYHVALAKQTLEKDYGITNPPTHVDYEQPDFSEHRLIMKVPKPSPKITADQDVANDDSRKFD